LTAVIFKGAKFVKLSIKSFGNNIAVADKGARFFF